MLKELLSDCSDVLVYRDSLGSTILHAASGRGQIEVVEELIASFDIITSKDNQGNTALHVAAFRGHLTVVEALVSASPSLSNIKNKVGDTFLHMAVAGFRTQGFNRLDRQMELVRQLIYGKVVKIHEIINIQNNYGRTALHVAVIGKMHPDLVKLLMSIPSINLNIRDVDGMTPLDLLSQSPPSASSDVVIKQLLCAGGLSNSDGFKAKSAIVSQLKMQCGIGNSPGSSFRISDVEILLHTGIEVSQTRGRPSSSSSVDKSEPPHFGTIQENQEYAGKKKVSANVDTAARRLKFLLRWPNQKEKRTDDESMGSLMKWSEQEETPTPLRQRFSKGSSSLINNKRTLAVKTSSASPATKKKLATGLMHGVIQAMPHLASTQQWTQVSPLSRPLVSSPKLEKRKVKGVHKMTGATSSSSTSQTEGCPSHRSGFMKAKLMNQYLCFKSNILEMEKPSNGRRHGRIFRSYVPAVA
ncbi:hypothetical protein HPP92_023383 [Vanilla planifolia]|uniref:Uncharacterized protein n=1 Tax=Vanilla planifolia TaxID=51239 RepID=A0A835PQ86_VANPL|nr:hypothetical protein HPP92_023383 [Vanilla planifolia]